MKNVILITIDCLRNDAVSCYGADLTTTPNIDAMAAEGLQYESCFATAGSTKFSFPALLGSIYYEMYDGARFPESVPLVSEVLSDEGYLTAGFNAANPNLTPDFGYTDGFDVYDDYITAGESDTGSGENDEHPAEVRDGSLSSPESGPGIVSRLKNVVRSTPLLYSFARFWYQITLYRLPNPYRKARNYLRYLRGETPNALSEHISPPGAEIVERGIEAASRAVQEERPFFLWLHLMEPHSWYNPDPEYVNELYDERISRSERFRANRALMSASPFRGTPDMGAVEKHLDTLKRLYYASVRQADAAVGDVREWLEERSLTDNTSVIVTADHGEEFLEHGGVQHSGDVYAELTHVPLVISDPDIATERPERVCSLIDVPPTLLSLVGVEPPGVYAGRDLLDDRGENSDTPHAISVKSDDESRVAARDDRYTLIREDGNGNKLFDRVEDPLEGSPLTTTVDELPELDAAIDDWQELVRDADLESKSVDPSESVEQQLEDLGYF